MAVDRKDFIIKSRKNGKKERLYRYKCDRCGADRGYLFSNKINGISPADRVCKGCRTNDVAVKNKGREPWNKGQLTPDSVKQKISQKLAGHEPPNKGQELALEERIRLSCNNRGITVEEFDGFSTPREEANRLRLRKQQLHKNCFEMYDYTCQKCGKRGITLNAHHMFSWKFFPELRYEISNLICLCGVCHSNFHAKFGRGTLEPNTKEQIDLFLGEKDAS